MIAIIDYDMGNVGSIANMLKKIGAKSKVTNDHDEIMGASQLILPGVGAFDEGMKKLSHYKLTELLQHQVAELKKPVLGICLGMQLLTEGSEEGRERGLGWINARTVKFKFDGNTSLRIPHMGWNDVQYRPDSKLFVDMYSDPRFYHVHSYHVVCDDQADVAATCEYGVTVCSAIERDNIFGSQFHPEKSHKYGMKLLENFCNL